MPTYDYVCDGCGHEFELFQSINDPVEKKCPACRKLKLRRLFGTGAAIVFKGSGFYQTDYRSDSYKKSAKADSESANKESTSKDGGSKESSGKDAGKQDSSQKEPKAPSSSEKPKSKRRDKGGPGKS